jgi:FkbM family methyltransferase
MIETLHWHTLHPRYLDAQSKVLDIGANYGLFAKIVTDRFSCECVAVEPAPGPFRGIPENDKITKIQAAVSGTPGTMSFLVDENNILASAITAADTEGSIEVEAITLPQLFDSLAWPRIDLLKVDIEGSEIAMLAACSDEFLSKHIAQISMEFHDFCGITPSEIVAQTLRRLHGLGFDSVRMSRIGHQDTWLINRNLLKISNAELLIIKHIVRNWFGFRRMSRRMLTAVKP